MTAKSSGWGAYIRLLAPLDRPDQGDLECVRPAVDANQVDVTNIQVTNIDVSNLGEGRAGWRGRRTTQAATRTHQGTWIKTGLARRGARGRSSPILRVICGTYVP